MESVKIDNSPEVLNTLKDHFLIAMPSLKDPYFKHSVVYICEHDEKGAMGFIINFPVKLTLQELLNNVDSIDHYPEPPLLNPVFLGGPLELERGFVLHSPVADNSQSTKLNDQLMVSNSNAILSTLGTKNEPEKYIVTLGYASWSSGQLEQEINDNHWISMESQNDIIFSTPVEQRWIESLQRLGINPEQLSTEIGHA
ncbi:YqgE/AlgH family protein [Psychromonas sp. MB-3u-54]|uniref:YqgE/AlgH family protein n=1 Tax=Psychromonas sp. MB-3u-54 TaxID=2058319 RepID=UPI000C326FEC|nr:YqgE/AlgH family protein [Psychromonas sp. MB-3u-54]PKH02030.1 YqgE/AlgH family protein [Psychromonas sp. MB-3u-54]